MCVFFKTNMHTATSPQITLFLADAVIIYYLSMNKVLNCFYLHSSVLLQQNNDCYIYSLIYYIKYHIIYYIILYYIILYYIILYYIILYYIILYYIILYYIILYYIILYYIIMASPQRYRNLKLLGRELQRRRPLNS